MASPPLLLEAQALLDRLVDCELPQAAREAMQGLKAAVAAAQPQPPDTPAECGETQSDLAVRLDQPLDEEVQRRFGDA
eukprot:12355027-Karenia_brevis.AAC.1